MSNDELARVFTTELSFVPEGATWQKMIHERYARHSLRGEA